MNFPYVPSILISSSLGDWSCCSGGSRRAMLSSSGRSCHGPANQGRAAPPGAQLSPLGTHNAGQPRPLLWRSHDFIARGSGSCPSLPGSWILSLLTPPTPHFSPNHAPQRKRPWNICNIRAPVLCTGRCLPPHPRREKERTAEPLTLRPSSAQGIPGDGRGRKRDAVPTGAAAPTPAA